MIRPGSIISYWDMCSEEGASLQRGMNYRLKGKRSVILMSLRSNAPYADRVEENGRVLIYEGHDAPREGNPNPKLIDQPMLEGRKLTQNGLFYQAATQFKDKQRPFELVRVYEKIRPGIWVYNGIFKLVDAWQEKSICRQVFKFRLEIIDEKQEERISAELD